MISEYVSGVTVAAKESFCKVATDILSQSNLSWNDKYLMIKIAGDSIYQVDEEKLPIMTKVLTNKGVQKAGSMEKLASEVENVSEDIIERILENLNDINSNTYKELVESYEKKGINIFNFLIEYGLECAPLINNDDVNVSCFYPEAFKLYNDYQEFTLQRKRYFEKEYSQE